METLKIFKHRFDFYCVVDLESGAGQFDIYKLLTIFCKIREGGFFLKFCFFSEIKCIKIYIPELPHLVLWRNVHLMPNGEREFHE